MGIFSSEYEYFAFSQTQSLIKDEDRVDTLGTFVASAARNEDENIPPNIIAATQAGMPGTAFKYFKYGKKDYYWGLPTSNFYAFTIDNDTIYKAIGYNKKIIQTYAPLDNNYLDALEYLHRQSWWNVKYSECVTPLLYKWDGGAESEYGKTIPDSFTAIRNGKYPQYINVTFPLYWNRAPSSQFRPTTYVISIPYNFNKGRRTGLWSIYVYRSQINDPEPGGWNSRHYWPPRYDIYDSYPSARFPVDTVVSKHVDFYPISVFRRGYTDYKSNSQWKKTLRKLLYQIGADADDIYEEFETAIRNSEASKAKLNEFYMGYFVQIQAVGNRDYKEPLVQYVYEMVKELFLTNPGNRTDYENFLQNLGEWNTLPTNEGRKPTPPERGMAVKEGDHEGGFYYTLAWSFIEKYTSFISHADAQSKFKELKGKEHENDLNLPVYAGKEWINGVEHLGDGSLKYISYLFYNNEARYYVKSPDGYIAARPEGGKWCPMAPELVKRMPFADQDAVLQAGLCAIVYSLQEQEIKWYSSNFWSGVILIITFVIAVLTLGAGINGVLTAVGLVAGTVAYTIIAMVVKFAVGFILQVGFALGGLDPTAVTLLTLAFAMASVMSPEAGVSNLSSTFGNFSYTGSIATGQMLGNIGKLFNIGKLLFNSTDVRDIVNAQEDYIQNEKDKQAEIDAAYLGTASVKISDPHLDLSRRLDNNIFESPSEFMARTTNINPGRAVINLPATFVDQTLTLPRGMNNATIIDIMNG